MAGFLDGLRQQKSSPKTELMSFIDAHVQANSLDPSVQDVVLGTRMTREGFLDSSVDKSTIAAAQSSFSSFSQMLRQAAANLSAQGIKLQPCQESAAAIASIIGRDPVKTFKSRLRTRAVNGMDDDGNSTRVVSDGSIFRMAPDAQFSRAKLAARGSNEFVTANEAYDSRDNKTSLMNTIEYNLNASYNNEFSEVLFPTIVCSNDVAGITCTVRLLMVYDAITRNISGAVTNYNKKNVLRAYADYTILQNDVTRLIPVVRPQNASYFVNPARFGSFQVPGSNGQLVTTAPLLVGTEFDLMGISTPTYMVSAGQTYDMTDSIAPAIKLETLFISVTGPTQVNGQYPFDALSVPTSNLPYSEFTYPTQDNYQQMVLNFNTTSVVLTPQTVQANGTDLAVLEPMVSGGYSVRLQISASGTVNTERGDTRLISAMVSVSQVFDSTGTSLDLTTGNGLTIANLFANTKVEGFWLDAYLTNSNRRERGQLIDTTWQTQIWNIPLRSPITSISPVSSDGTEDSQHLKALVDITNIRSDNQAMTSLIDSYNHLKSYKALLDPSDEGPDVLGIGRYLIRPTLIEDTIDMLAIVDSLKSQDRATDINAALITKLRQYWYQAYQDSEYKPAADNSLGANSPLPTAILATDLIISQWLKIEGDNQTLGNNFATKVITTVDNRMHGWIYMVAGNFAGDLNSGPNPLHFGSRGWKAEVVSTLPISRNNTINKEITVQPSWLHFMNCPLMVRIQVINLDKVQNKMAVDFHTV